MAPKKRLSLHDVLTDRRIALMLPLGFSSGLPFLLVFSTLSAWLREAGVTRTEIGLLSWLGFVGTYQPIKNPGYNQDRGPAHILGARAHVAF